MLRNAASCCCVAEMSYNLARVWYGVIWSVGQSPAQLQGPLLVVLVGGGVTWTLPRRHGQKQQGPPHTHTYMYIYIYICIYNIKLSYILLYIYIYIMLYYIILDHIILHFRIVYYIMLCCILFHIYILLHYIYIYICVIRCEI